MHTEHILYLEYSFFFFIMRCPVRRVRCRALEIFFFGTAKLRVWFPSPCRQTSRPWDDPLGTKDRSPPTTRRSITKRLQQITARRAQRPVRLGHTAITRLIGKERKKRLFVTRVASPLGEPEVAMPGKGVLARLRGVREEVSRARRGEGWKDSTTSRGVSISFKIETLESGATIKCCKGQIRCALCPRGNMHPF